MSMVMLIILVISVVITFALTLITQLVSPVGLFLLILLKAFIVSFGFGNSIALSSIAHVSTQ